MRYNRFILNIIIRSTILALTAILMAFLAFNREWLFTFIFTGVLFVIQIIFIIRYTGRVNRDLAHFLIHLKEQNTSLNFSNKNIDKLFGGLTKELGKINEEFKKIENEKIKNKHLLNLILDRVGTGILVINHNNDIKLYNKAILNLLGIESNNISELQNKAVTFLNENKELILGEQKIIHTHVNNITRRVLITLSEIKEDQEKFKIYSFHDIDREITDYELQSWNGLIKVLSHEIMNTLTPMSTTVDTLKDCLIDRGVEKNPDQLTNKDIQDAVKGTSLIETRVKSLQDFIKRFRQFLDIPIPELKSIKLLELVNDTCHAYQNKIDVEIEDVENNLTILADKSLIELVLVNIIKNSIEAHASRIRISTAKANKQVILELNDNGEGIDPSIMKKVLLPFYTTKEGGSGIGLSLARQIMYSHKGNLEILAIKEGTSIKLYFKTEIN
ncbi:PAS domain-containing sensor histidine kinase [Bacteroidota bacterium]